MDSFLVDIEQEEKEELISLMRRRFSTVEQAEEGLRIPYSNLKQHENGELDAMGLQNLGDLLSVVNLSDSRFRETGYDDEGLVEQVYDYTPRRFGLRDGVQDMVFRAFTADEVAETSDSSRQTTNRIRSGNSKRVPEPLYREMFERLDEELDEDVKFNADVVTAGGTRLLEEASPEQVLELYLIRKEFSQLAENRHPTREYMKSNVDTLQEILDSDETFFSGDDRTESALYSVLDEFGLMDYWGGNDSLYTKDAPDAYFQILEHEIRELIDDGQPRYREGELLYLLESVAEDLKESPAESFFDSDENDDLPSSTTYKNRFGSWNNALWRLGLETREHKYSEEELLSYIFEKYHEKGERPERAEIVNDPDAPSINAFENPEEDYSLDDFLDDAGVPDVDRMLDMRWYSETQPEYPVASEREEMLAD
jgi:hypothetical protein